MENQPGFAKRLALLPCLAHMRAEGIFGRIAKLAQYPICNSRGFATCCILSKPFQAMPSPFLAPFEIWG
jgi:hypothetical protein